MAEIKTREKSKGIKALDKAVVAGERMKRAFVRSKDQAENLLDDGQISPSEYAEDKVRYMAEDTAREVGHEAGKLTGKAKSACRSHREAKRTADAAQQDRTRIRHARSQTIKTAEARQRTVKQTAKSTGQATVKTAKGTVKTAQKSAKTAQQTSKAAIKTAEATAKATKAAAQTSAKAARTTAQAAKTAAQTLVAAAKAAAKAIASAAKAIAAAVKALVAAIAAGGWVALIVIVIICLIAAVVACFGIFFSSEDTGSDKPMRTVVQEINQEYQAQLDDIKGSVVYDTLVMSGSRAVWPEVLSVYAVKVTSDPDNPQEVATVTPEKEQILRDIFWAMNTICLLDIERQGGKIDLRFIPFHNLIIRAKLFPTGNAALRILRQGSLTKPTIMDDFRNLMRHFHTTPSFVLPSYSRASIMGGLWQITTLCKRSLDAWHCIVRSACEYKLSHIAGVCRPETGSGILLQANPAGDFSAFDLQVVYTNRLAPKCCHTNRRHFCASPAAW